MDHSWNWGRLSREDAVKELTGHPEGTFLVRMSQTEENAYSISVVYVALITDAVLPLCRCRCPKKQS